MRFESRLSSPGSRGLVLLRSPQLVGQRAHVWNDSGHDSRSAVRWPSQRIVHQRIGSGSFLIRSKARSGRRTPIPSLSRIVLGAFVGAMMVVSCQHGGATHADTVPSHADIGRTQASTARSYAGTDSLPVGVDSTRVDNSTRLSISSTNVDNSTRLGISSTSVDNSTHVGTRWLVIAPHPDDESLMAGGVLFRATQAGAEAAVVVVTNGDLDCLNDGVRRQGEAVAALSILGLPEDRSHFLGYPDGGLALLGRTPLPPRLRILDHACVSGNTTYGARGFGRRDYHSARFGSPALYTRDNAESDLAMLLDQLRPTDVVVSHPDDTHPDHVATYSLFRSALDRIIDVLPEAPRVHRAIVHNGDCWPTGNAAKEPCPAGQVSIEQPLPPLTGRLSGYLARERVTVPASWLLTDPETNPKARAIAAHSSQTRNSSASYLFSFVRSDEAFFPEWLGKVAGHWRRIPQPT